MPDFDFDFEQFDVLTFDCYGTLIDWEAGILEALRAPLAAHGITDDDETVLADFAKYEARLEAGPYRRYRDVLGEVLRSITADAGDPTEVAEDEAFGASVADWPAFPDSAEALARLHERFKLGVITNCDDDLFAASEEKLGLKFDWVVTAQQAKRYKPNPRGFELMFERVGLPPSRILHVAQSLYHDHVPAKRLGLSTVWVHRRGERPGSGATPPADATPDLTVPNMAALAALAGPEVNDRGNSGPAEPGSTHQRPGGSGADDPLRERLVSSEVLRRGRILEFRIDTVEAADGHRSTRDIAGHPGGVCVVALDPQDRVLLVRQWRHAIGGALLEIPAGTLDRAEDGSIEDHALAGARELEEETGSRASTWRYLGGFYTAPGFTSELMHLYLATDLTAVDEGGLAPDEDERLELRSVPFTEALAMAERGELQDAKTLVGLFLVARLRDAAET